MSAKIGRRVLKTKSEANFGRPLPKQILDHAAVAHGGKVVTGLPAAGIGLAAHVVEPGLEGFEIGVAVAIEIEPQLVEIPQAAIDRQIAAPIIRIALEGDAFAGIDVGDHVWAAADRFLERRALERRGIDGVFRQYRHQRDDQRQFAVAAFGKIEPHGARIENLGLGDLGIVGAVIRPAVIAQKLPREGDVLGGDRRAVGKMRRRIEREGHEAARIVGVDGARQQAVERERLVIAARHQALDHVAADRLHREALDDHRIEAVEGAEHALDQPAALGRVGVGIGKRDKAVSHGRFAVHGDSMSRFRQRRRRQGNHAGKRQRAAQRGPHSGTSV